MKDEESHFALRGVTLEQLNAKGFQEKREAHNKNVEDSREAYLTQKVAKSGENERVMRNRGGNSIGTQLLPYVPSPGPFQNIHPNLLEMRYEKSPPEIFEIKPVSKQPPRDQVYGYTSSELGDPVVVKSIKRPEPPADPAWMNKKRLTNAQLARNRKLIGEWKKNGMKGTLASLNWDYF